MPLRLRFMKLERRESNFVSAFLNLLAATMAITALGSNEWLMLDNGGQNVTATSEGIFDFSVPPLKAHPCDSIGARDFWRTMRIGGFDGEDGKMHVVFHAPGRILVDCINPTMATLFYALIATSFAVVIVASCASLLHLVAPQAGFFAWMRRNTILEMCIMLLTLVACLCALAAQNELQEMRPNDDISIGPGLFLVSLAGLMSFAGAACSIRHWAKVQRGRRIENQRLTRPRALPAWRGVDRRAEDQMPIIDFESYLDSGKPHSSECLAETESTVFEEGTNSTELEKF